MMAAAEQAFQQRFGMDAGWAHNVLFYLLLTLKLPCRQAG